MRSSSPPFNPSAPANLPANPTVVSPADFSAGKAAGTLDPNVTYQINTSAMTGGVVFLSVDGAGIVSHDARYYDPAISDQTLIVEYHCDSDRIHKAIDTVREVEVIGEAEVDAFPWGNTSITESRFHNSSITYISGTIRGLFMTGESTLINDGTIIDSTIQGRSNVSNDLSGTINDVVLNSDSTLTNSGSISNSNLSSNALLNNSGTITNTNITSGGIINNTGTGSINEVTVSENSQIRLTGTGRIFYSVISANGVLFADNWSGNFYYNHVSNASTVRLDGSSGSIQRNNFLSFTRANFERSVHDTLYNEFSSASVTLQDNAVAIMFRQNSIDSEGFLRINRANGGSFLFNKISSRGFFSSTIGYSGIVRYLTLTSNGQVNNANGFSGLINQVDVTSTARLRLTDSAMLIQYASFHTFAQLLGERGSTQSIVTHSNIGRSSLNLRDVIQFGFVSNNVSGLSTISGANGNGGQILQCNIDSDANIVADGPLFVGTVRYSSFSSGSTLNVRALVGTLQRTELHSLGRLTVNLTGTCSNLNYNNIAITLNAAINNDVQGY